MASTSLGSYDDAELLALVSGAGTALSLSDDEVLRFSSGDGRYREW